MADGEVVARNAPGGYLTVIGAGEHVLVVDEPVALGGTDQGPDPYDLLLGALGACTAITLRMYAGRKGWPLENVTIRLRQARSHAQDCADCETEDTAIPRIEARVELEGPLTAEQKERLLWIAGRCPVKQTLAAGIPVEVKPYA